MARPIEAFSRLCDQLAVRGYSLTYPRLWSCRCEKLGCLHVGLSRFCLEIETQGGGQCAGGKCIFAHHAQIGRVIVTIRELTSFLVRDAIGDYMDRLDLPLPL